MNKLSVNWIIGGFTDKQVYECCFNKLNSLRMGNFRDVVKSLLRPISCSIVSDTPAIKANTIDIILLKSKMA